MPKATDPGSSVPIVLDSDQSKDPQPTFVFKVPTMRRELELGLLFDQAYDGGPQQTFDTINGELTKDLVNWKHMNDAQGKPIQFNAETFADLVNHSEALEIAGKLLSAGRLDTSEKKDSE